MTHTDSVILLDNGSLLECFIKQEKNGYITHTLQVACLSLVRVTFKIERGKPTGLFQNKFGLK
jgi:hypothetical protein